MESGTANFCIVLLFSWHLFLVQIQIIKIVDKVRKVSYPSVLQDSGGHGIDNFVLIQPQENIPIDSEWKWPLFHFIIVSIVLIIISCQEHVVTALILE